MTLTITGYKVKFWSKLLRKFCEQEFETFDEAYKFSKDKFLAKVYVTTKKTFAGTNA